MCIGLPMQVVESGPGYAHCQGLGIERRVDTMLVGEQAPGTWLLVFLDSAREVLNENDAQRITDAVSAINQVMQEDSAGSISANSLDHLFADLVDREPPKPASLIALEQQQQQKS